MEIPLVLTSPQPNRLVYGFPLWYRVVMGLILAMVATALLMEGSAPGVMGWIILIILLLGTLYEDKWIFDSADGRITHRAGLLIAARSTVIEYSDLQNFLIVPLVKGTIPGTEDEKAENEAALKGNRSDDGQITRNRHKKPFLSLEIEHVDGSRYLVDHVPARKADSLRGLAKRIASHCGATLVDGI